MTLALKNNNVTRKPLSSKEKRRLFFLYFGKASLIFDNVVATAFVYYLIAQIFPVVREILPFFYVIIDLIIGTFNEMILHVLTTFGIV